MPVIPEQGGGYRRVKSTRLSSSYIVKSRSVWAPRDSKVKRDNELSKLNNLSKKVNFNNGFCVYSKRYVCCANNINSVKPLSNNTSALYLERHS